MNDIYDYRFAIVVYANIINRWRTDNLDSALHKIKSMVGKITFEFIDNKKNLCLTINDYEDYQTLLEIYRGEQNESRFIQKEIISNWDISR